jgi:hypothetical protein
MHIKYINALIGYWKDAEYSIGRELNPSIPAPPAFTTSPFHLSNFMPPPYSTKSAFHNIELIEYGVVEPNNGRMLYEIDLKINDEVVTDRYFSRGWHHINIYRIYEPDSPDGRFFYVPAEGGGFLLDVPNNFSVIGLSGKALSAAKYIGNLFFSGKMFLVYTDEVVVFDMLTLKVTTHDFPTHNVQMVRPIDTQQFAVIYFESGSWEEKSLAVAFK